MLGSARAETVGFLSSDDSSRLSTIPHDAEFQQVLLDSGVGRLAVRHQGWNETMASWAQIQVHELTGRRAIHGQDPIFTVLSMMYEPHRWFEARFLPIEHPRIAEIMGLEGKWVSPRQIIENDKNQDLTKELQEAQSRKDELAKLVKTLNVVEQVQQLGSDRPGLAESLAGPQVDLKEVQRLLANEDALAEAHERRRELTKQTKQEKAFLEAGTRLFTRTSDALSLHEKFLLVPDPDSPTGEWVAPTNRQSRVQSTAFGTAAKILPAGRQFDSALTAAFDAGAGDHLASAVDEFASVAERLRSYPDQTHRALTNLYIRLNPFKLAAYVYFLAAALFGLFVFFRKPGWRIAGTSVLVAGLLVHTGAEAIRLVLTGHMPVSNMYESITFTAWAALVLGTGFELWKRKGAFGLAAAIVGLVALLGVSLMPLHETRLHPLRAVLKSYWLNIHVTMMLISYGAFAVAAIFAGGYMIKSLIGRDALLGGKALMPLEQMEELAYRLVQIAWPILTIGIMLGAVWADTAWGRYWGWDPKETWALITWIVYTIYLHTRMVMGWKGRISALACLAGFLMVLVTWIGVSYIPWFAGGLHTYASPM
ncbi:c-type cytochrome biogenesis protein CcsB [bacterium]|nr:c-type cytochrome biogenesis protein CcsB [bacterium]